MGGYISHPKHLTGRVAYLTLIGEPVAPPREHLMSNVYIDNNGLLAVDDMNHHFEAYLDKLIEDDIIDEGDNIYIPQYE